MAQFNIILIHLFQSLSSTERHSPWWNPGSQRTILFKGKNLWKTGCWDNMFQISRQESLLLVNNSCHFFGHCCLCLSTEKESWHGRGKCRSSPFSLHPSLQICAAVYKQVCTIASILYMANVEANTDVRSRAWSEMLISQCSEICGMYVLEAAIVCISIASWSSHILLSHFTGVNTMGLYKISIDLKRKAWMQNHATFSSYGGQTLAVSTGLRTTINATLQYR